MTGDVSGLSLDDTVDLMLDGRVEEFDLAFTRHSLAAAQAYLVLAAAIRQLQTLHLLRAGMAGKSASAAVAAARPPIFQARRRTAERVLERAYGDLDLSRTGSRRDLAVAVEPGQDGNRLGWSVAAFALAHAEDLGVHQVWFDGLTWKAGRDSEDGWTASPAASDDQVRISLG